MRARLMLPAALAFAASLSAAPPEIRNVTPLPVLTMCELATNPRATLVNRERHEERESFGVHAPAVTAAATIVTTTTPNAGTIPAPPATAGFRPAYDRLVVYPSDAGGAVGRTQIVSVTNAEYTVHDRDGKRLMSIAPEQFWFSESAPAGEYFDARAVYDRVNDRFIIAGLFDVSLTKGEMLIAVSMTKDASGEWARYRFRINQTLSSWDGDFTRIAMTRDAVVITANLYGGDASLGSMVYVVATKDLLTPSFPLKLASYKFGGPDNVPVTSYDDPTIYLARAESDYFDVNVLTPSGNTLVAVVKSPANLATFGGPWRAGNQIGLSYLIDCGLPTLHAAAIRNGVVWAVESGYSSSPLRASVRWWRLNLASPATTAQSALIDDPTGAKSFAFPSIAVNAAGAALIGYSYFAPDVYASNGYTYIDALGRTSPPTLLKTGDSVYTIGRWADFSETMVDPTNDADFWTVQTYATALPDDSHPRWATWWGKIQVPPARGRVARK